MFHKQFTVQTSSSGNFSIMIMPNPICAAVVPLGASSDLSTWNYPSGGSAVNSFFGAPSASLSGKINNWRVVGYGVRVKDIASLSNVSGLIQVAMLPVQSVLPAALPVGGHNNTNSADTLDVVYTAYGLPYTGTGDSAVIDSASLAQFPDYAAFDGYQVAKNPLDIIPKICDPSAFAFKQSSDRVFGDNVGIGLATGSIYTGDASYGNVGGFQTCVICGSGFPNSTNCVNIEIIAHLEGNPNVSSSAGGLSSGTGDSITDMAGFFGALQHLASSPSFRLVANAVGGVAGRFVMGG